MDEAQVAKLNADTLVVLLHATILTKYMQRRRIWALTILDHLEVFNGRFRK